MSFAKWLVLAFSSAPHHRPTRCSRQFIPWTASRSAGTILSATSIIFSLLRDRRKTLRSGAEQPSISQARPTGRDSRKIRGCSCRSTAAIASMPSRRAARPRRSPMPSLFTTESFISITIMPFREFGVGTYRAISRQQMRIGRACWTTDTAETGDRFA